jgi:copper chaperone CopZ
MTMQGSNAAAPRLVLSISGMTCGGCAGAVSRALTAVPGVVEARIDLAAGRATIMGNASAEELLRAVHAAGFEGAVA